MYVSFLRQHLLNDWRGLLAMRALHITELDDFYLSLSWTFRWSSHSFLKCHTRFFKWLRPERNDVASHGMFTVGSDIKLLAIRTLRIAHHDLYFREAPDLRRPNFR